MAVLFATAKTPITGPPLLAAIERFSMPGRDWRMIALLCGYPTVASLVDYLHCGGEVGLAAQIATQWATQRANKPAPKPIADVHPEPVRRPVRCGLDDATLATELAHLLGSDSLEAIASRLGFSGVDALEYRLRRAELFALLSRVRDERKANNRALVSRR